MHGWWMTGVVAFMLQFSVAVQRVQRFLLIDFFFCVCVCGGGGRLALERPWILLEEVLDRRPQRRVWSQHIQCEILPRQRIHRSIFAKVLFQALALISTDPSNKKHGLVSPQFIFSSSF